MVIDAGHGGRDPGATSVSGQIRRERSDAGARPRASRRPGRARAGARRDDPRRRSLPDARRARGRRPAARRRHCSCRCTWTARPIRWRAARASIRCRTSRPTPRRRVWRLARMPAAAVRASRTDRSMRCSPTSRCATQMSASADLATRLVRKSAGRFELRPEPHRFAAFHVLRRADTPAVLFEAGYISNADDEAAAARPRATRRRSSLALAQAIEADVAARMRGVKPNFRAAARTG